MSTLLFTHSHSLSLNALLFAYSTILHEQLPLLGSLTLSHSRSAHPPAEGNDSSSIGLGCCSSPSVAIDISPRVIPLSTGSSAAVAGSRLGSAGRRFQCNFGCAAVLMLVSTSLCNKTGKQNLPSARLCVFLCVCLCVRKCNCVSLRCFVRAVSCRATSSCSSCQRNRRRCRIPSQTSPAIAIASQQRRRRRGVVCCACRGRIYKFFAYFHFSFNFCCFCFRVRLFCAYVPRTIALGWLPFEY